MDPMMYRRGQPFTTPTSMQVATDITGAGRYSYGSYSLANILNCKILLYAQYYHYQVEAMKCI